MAKLQLFVAISAVLLIAGIPAIAGTPASTNAFVKAILGAPQYSTLVTAVNAAGLLPALQSACASKPLTIFAPDNDAFGSLPKASLEYLTTDPKGKTILAEILKYHIVPGSFPNPKPQSDLLNLLRKKLWISGKGQELLVNNVPINAPKVIFVDGSVVHGIKKVLIPRHYDYIEKEKAKETNNKWGWLPWNAWKKNEKNEKPWEKYEKNENEKNEKPWEKNEKNEKNEKKEKPGKQEKPYY